MRGFGELEAAVMRQLWAAGGPVTVRQVHTALVEERDLAYTTVLTVMDKLHRKRWLRRAPQGRAHVYEAVATREQYGAGLMREALTDSGDREQTLLHFLGQMTLDEAAARASMSWNSWAARAVVSRVAPGQRGWLTSAIRPAWHSRRRSSRSRCTGLARIPGS